MQIVHYSSQERVDLPDMTAMSSLVVGEFRRTVRGLFLGPRLAGNPDYESFIVRGFLVEQQAVPDATVRVRLDPGGTSPLGFAIGGENLGSRIDFGQLIGGDGMDGALEGNASYTLDFSAQPPGSYTVQMRFVYATGANDNRAFWDSGADSEFIAATDTRTLPSIELRLAGAPSNEWITLATVAWGGATIVTGNITDARTFPLEGTTPYQQTLQTSGAGMPDFNRGTDRGAVGVNEVYPALRALARQVQDIKGPDDTGHFNWWARVFSPLDPAGTFTTGTTKTMRSIDTVTYTVGDGTTCFGDFNGAAGLDACLAHIASLATANLPERIEIVVHGGAATYSISDNYFINATTRPCTVVIRAGVKHDHSGSVVGTYGNPLIQVNGGNLNAGEYALTVGSSISGGNIELRNLHVTWTGTTAGGRGMFAAAGWIHAVGCTLSQTLTPAVDAGYVLLSSFAPNFLLSESLVFGRIGVYGPGTGGSVPAERNGGRIERSRLEQTQLVLHADTASLTATDVVNGFTITESYFSGRTTAPYTAVAGVAALIDARSSYRLRVLRSTFLYGTNENCIDGRSYNASHTTTPYKLSIEDCLFTNGISNGTHTVGSGTNGAEGTGWAIAVNGGRSTSIKNVRLEGVVTTDAGGILITDGNDLAIDGVDFDFCGHTAGGSDTFTGIKLTGSSTGPISGHVRGVQAGDWQTGMARVRMLDYDRATSIVTSDCILDGSDGSFAALPLSATYGAIRLHSVSNLTFSDIQLSSWSSNTNNSRTVLFDGSTDNVMLSGCMFAGCGGFPIVRVSGSPLDTTIDNCLLQHSNTNGDGFDLSSMLRVRVTNCSWSFPAAKVALRTSTSGFLVMGCVSANGEYNKTAGTGRGYNEVGQDLNAFSAYT